MTDVLGSKKLAQGTGEDTLPDFGPLKAAIRSREGRGDKLPGSRPEQEPPPYPGLRLGAELAVFRGLREGSVGPLAIPSAGGERSYL